MKNKFVHYGAVLFIIAAVSAGILAAVNGFTSQVIANNAIQLVTEARKQVLPAAASFKEEEGKEEGGGEEQKPETPPQQICACSKEFVPFTLTSNRQSRSPSV